MVLSINAHRCSALHTCCMSFWWVFAECTFVCPIPNGAYRVKC
jgi:hypothetical protein